MEEKISKKKKGVKATLLEMKKGETVKFPRKRYSSLIATRSIARVEYPDRDWDITVIPDAISVVCLK